MNVNNYNNNSIRYTVGGADTGISDSLTSNQSLKEISDSITFQLRNVHPQGKVLSIDKKEIVSMISDILDTFVPSNVGDIYSREFIQLSKKTHEEEIKEMVINSFVNSIKNEYDTIEKNKKFSKMNTVYGDFNEAGLQAFPNSLIKLNEKNTNKTFLFNMRY